MTHQKSILEKLLQIKNQVKRSRPLIHCLTNAISINDCANVVLALGGKPIMAEHPKEVVEVTSIANALAINLGNITDQRIESMLLSAKVAHEKQIPWVIDLVGVGCSKLRRDLAQELIKNDHPHVIKGNMSEIKAIAQKTSHAEGIDVGKQDQITEDNLTVVIDLLQDLAKQTDAIIVATGTIDVVVQRERTYMIANGTEMLTRLTGTGCMINVMIATFLASGHDLEASILAVAMMGIAGECSQHVKGNGSFKVELLDTLYSMSDETLTGRIKLIENEGE